MRRLIPLGLSVLVVGAGGSGRPSLVEAAKNADAQSLRALLRQGVHVDAVDADGSTALLWVSYHDDLPSADLLIEAGANVNAGNDLGATPLWAASQNGSTNMVGRLLKAGANPNAALPSGETPVMVAARAGYPTVVEQLLAKGADVNARGARAQTALMWAAAQKHADVVKVLLAHGAKVGARSEAWTEVMAVPPHGLPEYNRIIPHGADTALLFAARSGDLESATLLVDAGADVNDQDAWGVSTTVLAAHSGYGPLVHFLLERGANPNAAAAGFAALHEAIMRRDRQMVAALLDHGADPGLRLGAWTPTRRDSKDLNFHPALVGASPFWLAARFDEPEIMRLLVQHGADPLFVHHGSYWVEGRGGQAFEQRSEMTTALMAAVGMTRGTPWVLPDPGERESLALETVKLAVALGIDINAAGTDGRTALDGAEALKYRTVVTYLVEKGARRGAKKSDRVD
jgi:ankyrin repeat protein